MLCVGAQISWAELNLPVVRRAGHTDPTLCQGKLTVIAEKLLGLRISLSKSADFLGCTQEGGRRVGGSLFDARNMIGGLGRDVLDAGEAPARPHPDPNLTLPRTDLPFACSQVRPLAQHRHPDQARKRHNDERAFEGTPALPADDRTAFHVSL